VSDSGVAGCSIFPQPVCRSGCLSLLGLFLSAVRAGTPALVLLLIFTLLGLALTQHFFRNAAAKTEQ